jgi:hypothetical protein
MIRKFFIDGKLDDQQFGEANAWVAKYARSKLLWKRQLGTSSYDIRSAIATDNSDNVYLTGYTSRELGDQSYGGFDAWAAKYKP